MVLRKRVTTLHFEATNTRSCNRMSLLAAAAISGVIPAASALRVWVSAASVSSQSRNCPTVNELMGAKAAASWLSRIRRVTSSCSYGTTASFKKRLSGTSASSIWARTRSSSLAAATPASTSPDLWGDALARISRSGLWAFIHTAYYRNVLGKNMAISGKSITNTSPTIIIMTIGTMEEYMSLSVTPFGAMAFIKNRLYPNGGVM